VIKWYRVVLFFLILGLLILFSAPMIMSFRIARHYPNFLAELSRSNPRFNIELVSFQRGWFKSHARLKLTLKSKWMKLYSDQSDVANEITMYQTIKAGPILLSSTLFPSNDSIFNVAIIDTRVQDRSLQLRATTLWTFHGVLSTRFSMNSLGISNGQQRLQIVNGSGDLILDAKSHRLNMQLNIGSGNFTSRSVDALGVQHEHVLYFDGLRTSGQHQREAGLWIGNREMRIDRLMLSSEDHPIFNCHQISGAISHHHDAENSRFDIHYTIGNITSYGILLGPAFIKFSLDRINNKALLAFLERLSDQSDRRHGADFGELVSKGLTIKLQQLSLDTDSDPETQRDKLLANGEIEIKPFSTKPSLTTVLVNSDGEGQVRLPKTLLHNVLVNYYSSQPMLQSILQQSSPEQRAAATLTHWLEQRYLEATLSQLQVHWQLKEGQLLLNGQQLEPSASRISNTPAKITPLW